MNTKSNHDYSISLIRLIATFSIIICHIMQYLDIELAWWFNVGVQIFLCMSGFLYGKRDQVNDDLSFYKRTALKILIDYYVVVIPVILLFVVFLPQKISITTIIKVLVTRGTLPGGEHLWYIPYCLFCYLITPFLSRYFNNHKNKHVMWHFLLLSIVVIVITELFLYYFNSAWIFCYILGFFLGSISTNDKRKLYNSTSFLIFGGAILSNTIQIFQDYIIKLELPGIVALLYSKFCNYAHVALGVALFIFLKSIFSRAFKTGYPHSIQKLCSCSDKYSYDVYLVHQFVILGPFSLMQFTETIEINLLVIMSIVVTGAFLVNSVSTYIRNKAKTVTDI